MADQIPVETAMAHALAGYDLNCNEFRKEKLDITDALVTQAQDMLQELQQQSVMMTLTDQRISDFAQKIFKLVSQEIMSARDQGLMNWAPKVCVDNRTNIHMREQIIVVCANSQYITPPDSGPLKVKFTPLITRYSKMYNSYWNEGHDEQGNYLGFWGKQEVPTPVVIKCRIKKHESRRGLNFNLLNYVKVQRTQSWD